MNFPFRDSVHSVDKTTAAAAIPDTLMDVDSVPETGPTAPEHAMDVDVPAGDLRVDSVMKGSRSAAEKMGDDSASEQHITQIDDDEPPCEVEE